MFHATPGQTGTRVPIRAPTREMTVMYLGGVRTEASA